MQAGEKYIAIVRWGKTINKRGTVQKPPEGKSLQKKKMKAEKCSLKTSTDKLDHALN